MASRLPTEPDDAVSKEVYRIREELIQLVEQHRLECDDTECPFSPNLIAFMAHAVGLTTSSRINAMETLLDEYNRDCPRCSPLN